MKVSCGCGRTMTLDALRGRGAYRCGCGARIKVDEPERPATQCSAPGCRAIAVASSLSARLCREHDHDHLLEILPRVLSKYPPPKWLEAFREHEERFGVPAMGWTKESVERATEAAAVRPPLEPANSVVYFLCVGDMVKIGTTLRLKARMESFNAPPGAEAYVIQGSYRLESHLHAKFKPERHGGTEWFTLSPRLAEYIAKHAPATPAWTRSSRSTTSPAPTPTASPASTDGGATATPMEECATSAVT